MKKLLFLMIPLLYLSCDLNPVTNQFDTWTNRLCCQNEQSKLSIDYLEISANMGIQLSSHDLREHRVKRISLLKKGKDQYNTIVDISSSLSKSNNEFIHLSNEIPTLFEGDYLFSKTLEDGNYRMFISTDQTCGEIIFDVEDRNVIRKEFNCLITKREDLNKRK